MNVEIIFCFIQLDINLKGNPISDRRLLKLIDQCRTKQILDYVKQHCPKEVLNNTSGDSKKGKKSKGKDTSEQLDKLEKRLKITVEHFKDDDLKIIILDDVKNIRPYLAGCIVKNIEFTEESFKKFIQLQTKLHEGVCQKRNLATIATHDLKKLVNTYDIKKYIFI